MARQANLFDASQGQVPHINRFGLLCIVLVISVVVAILIVAFVAPHNPHASIQ